MNGERSYTTKIWPQLSWIESWSADGLFTSMGLRGEPAISNWKRPCFRRQNGSEFPELAAQNFRNPQKCLNKSGKRWLTLLRNLKEAIAAMDFFTVPTVIFSVLYCFFPISQDRQRILHFNITKHPTSLWIVQQLRQALPFDSAHRFLLYRT